MTIKEWAQLLNGREYTHEMNSMEERQAKEDQVVIVFGASDDLLEFRGFIDDEFGAWNGTTVKITCDASIFDEDMNRETFQYNKDQINSMPEIQSVWCPKDENGKIWASWEIISSIPHETFDIMEDDEIFCRGIVFKWMGA